MGIGGVGANAVQGCRAMSAGHIIAVDPVEMKREMAMVLGATQAVASIDEAAEIARDLTNGQGADAAIVTVGVTTGEHLAQAFAAIRKAGTVVATGVGPEASASGQRPRAGDVPEADPGRHLRRRLASGADPRLIEMYRSGQLISTSWSPARIGSTQINDAYDDMHAGRNIRGVIEFATSSSVIDKSLASFEPECLIPHNHHEVDKYSS